MNDDWEDRFHPSKRWSKVCGTLNLFGPYRTWNTAKIHEGVYVSLRTQEVILSVITVVGGVQ